MKRAADCSVALFDTTLPASLQGRMLNAVPGAAARVPAGEDVVTKDSFISICWRLIPYYLNNWEQDWGAECSSMMFELPHFALELLVVLPSVQVG